jgi:hypothetical protein
MSEQHKMTLRRDGIWDLKENGICLAWSWTIKAMCIAFAETPELLEKIKKQPGWHVYAFTKHMISEDKYEE